MRTSGHRIPSPSLGSEREIISLAVVPAATRRLLIGWLSLALASLVVAGIFAAIAAFARTPVVHTLFSPNAFRLALTSHVTFAFTVWFVTFAGVLWVYVAWRSNYALGVGASWAALSLAALGSAAMAVPAFLASGQPYLNDYLPVIDQPFFWAGLVLVFLASFIIYYFLNWKWLAAIWIVK